jgi:hypothetical protein
MTKTKMSAIRNGSNGAAQKESTEATKLKTLDDSTHISLAIAINKASNALAQRDGDELLKLAETALALTQAADIIHGWTREKPLKVKVDL